MGYRPLSFFAVLDTLLWLSFASSNNASEAYYRRNVFYAGGEYSFVPSTNSTISINQIYVEQLNPLHGKKRRYPIVFFHGGGVSGTVRTGILLDEMC